jgi:hypothetical protein
MDNQDPRKAPPADEPTPPGAAPPESNGADDEESPFPRVLVLGDLFRLPNLMQWAFYAFLFTIPFEEMDIGIPVTPSKLFGYLFLMTTILQPRACYRRAPAAIWWSFGYACFYLVRCAELDSSFLPDFFKQLLVVVQLQVLFWVGYNILRYEQVARRALLSLALACLCVSCLQVAGIGATYETRHQKEELEDVPQKMDRPPAPGEEVRVSTFGQNANEQADMLGMGLLILIGLSYAMNRSLVRPRWLTWPAFALMGFAVVQTGSRGGLLALAAGIVVLFFGAGDRGARRKNRLRNLGLAALALAVIVGYCLRSETTRERWRATLTEGNVAHRDSIYKQALQMIEEKPILGWGPIMNRVVLNSRVEGGGGDTHNLILWIVTESGLIGGIPFFVCVFMCTYAAWQARDRLHGILPFALVVHMWIANMSGTWHYRKHFWLVFAYGLASASYPMASSAVALVGRSAARLAGWGGGPQDGKARRRKVAVPKAVPPGG